MTIPRESRPILGNGMNSVIYQAPKPRPDAIAPPGSEPPTRPLPPVQPQGPETVVLLSNEDLGPVAPRPEPPPSVPAWASEQAAKLIPKKISTQYGTILYVSPLVRLAWSKSRYFTMLVPLCVIFVTSEHY